MFSSALKSISATNITANYSVSPTPTSTAGPWKIYDAKKKSTGKPYSVFVFDKKALDSHGSSLGRSGASSYKRSVDEVVERLKKEASSLAKLRHPSILELVEPVEETRGGGLQFVTEAVTASLASVLQEKDEQERAGGPGGRSSRYVTEDADGVRRRRELEIDELEIQKGLLQLSKALEFLHENAGLVHGNLTPDAVLINAKSDWKISGFAFCSPAEGSNKPTSIQGINLYEVLNMDPRLPRLVQLNLDYTSPDFVMDNNLTPSADMFSLGLLSVALYNSPHQSPLESHASLSSYKRLFSSSSSVPSSSNNFLSSRPLPKELSHHVLPRLITRRPAQRMTAREFQQSEFFDNILVSTIRFLDSFPAKTPNEKSQFLKGLVKVLPSFPKSVMEKKILPGLLDELKDRDLLAAILQNVFKIIELLPSARRAFGEKVRPALKEIFVVNAKQTQEKDPARDAGLMVFLEHLQAAADNSSGKEFKDDILPVILAAIECPTHSIVDAAMRTLPSVLPVLDFSTIKNELFPVVAAVFSRTNSLAIKVRGLQAFVILCGGSADAAADDGLNGLVEDKRKTSSSSALDKYTMQEKIVPLIRAIKTKEPAVMVAALNVLRIVGQSADAEFVAMDILPVLWSMSLGPLLDLKQFQTFMELIKNLSRRVEDEQSKKLQETSGSSNGATAGPNDDFLAFGGVTGTAFDASSGGGHEDDFESLVKGRPGAGDTSASNGAGLASWDETPSSVMPTTKSPSTTSTPQTPSFSWSTQTPASPMGVAAQPPSQGTGFRTVTPDLTRFGSLTPSSTQFSQPLQPTLPSQSSFQAAPAAAQPSASPSFNWSSSSSSTAAAATANPWASAASSTPNSYAPNYSSANPLSTMPSGFGGMTSSMGGMTLGAQRPSIGGQRSSSSSFSLPPPPGAGGGSSAGAGSSFGIKPPPPPQQQQQQQQTGWPSANKPMGSMGGGLGNTTFGAQQQQQQQQHKSGLDKYESLI
ncbi:Protein kinase domain-containing protein ppk32 [Purpureocillium takamizusanense]|uniref:Protein kinase domain-containing protein ppk32 n=1 Tax=Purpureocillium takamizusanense TaxID=2060973 RepID=A0A9Q8QEN8_9HYPO|nr:Protein kinase domain-containing protein ppk32 [Purpureocillium takamizusanense]UNI18250.1 Protein kinase domain-containing protein ppk32 [Purpureocillium takamizusanense]